MEESHTGTLTTDEMLRWLQEHLPEVEYRIRHHVVKRKPEGPSGSGPLHAPIPIDVEAMLLAQLIKHALTVGSTVLVPRLYHRVRDYLGYARMVKLTSTSCHVCGGQLIVAEDASTDVMCIAEGCGNVYRQADWIEILYSQCDAT